MKMKQLILTSAAALAIGLAGTVMAESPAQKAADDATVTGANAEQKEANLLQQQADQAAKDAAAARAKSKAAPTAANERAAKIKTEEAVDAAAVAGGMEGKAAAQEKAASEVK